MKLLSGNILKIHEDDFWLKAEYLFENVYRKPGFHILAAKLRFILWIFNRKNMNNLY